jgi:hypothetical protein
MLDDSVVDAALAGLKAQRKIIDEQIIVLEAARSSGSKRDRNKGSSPSPSSPGFGTSKRVISVEARGRMAAAQKKRWANRSATVAAPRAAVQK